MQVVIEIPEVFYEALRKTDIIVSGQRSGKTLMSVIYNAVANGTPLPMGHGKLIDADETIANLQKQCDEVFKLGKVKPEDYYIAKDAKFMQDTWRTWCVDFNKWLTNRPVVIPADKDGESNG